MSSARSDDRRWRLHRNDRRASNRKVRRLTSTVIRTTHELDELDEITLPEANALGQWKTAV